MQRLNQLLVNLERQRFWGRLTLQFRSGQVILVRKEETLLAERKDGGTDDAEDQKSR